jgi:hypothetical protein
LSRLREQYIETGQLRFTYKHFAILGPESSRTAEASECAAEQDKFWAYHDRLFADQTTTRSTLNDERLIELAVEVGLDPDALNECLNSGRFTSKVRQETLSVQSMGVRGTPAFLINGIFISGAQPFEVFQQVIEEQLGNAPTQADPPPATEEPADQKSEALEASSAGDGIEGVLLFPDPGTEHQDGVIEYPQPVPPGGEHSAAWQNCGIYTEPVPIEPVIHALEHGAVWIAYQPDLPSDQVEILRAVVRQEQQNRGESLVLLAPMPEQSPMEAPVVATAWRVQLQLDNASDERLAQFLDIYQNGPYAPEPGAPCTEGVGEPLEF